MPLQSKVFHYKKQLLASQNILAQLIFTKKRGGNFTRVYIQKKNCFCVYKIMEHLLRHTICNTAACFQLIIIMLYSKQSNTK